MSIFDYKFIHFAPVPLLMSLFDPFTCLALELWDTVTDRLDLQEFLFLPFCSGGGGGGGGVRLLMQLEMFHSVAECVQDHFSPLCFWKPAGSLSLLALVMESCLPFFMMLSIAQTFRGETLNLARSAVSSWRT